ncbi:MAG: HAD-IA family hydrolase [Brachyspira sp.]|nr:HAD-IA family hydrolase [Brachyspira sp.]
MSIIDKIFNYSEDYRYKTWKIFGIKFSVVKKYNSKKINIYEEIKKHDIISFDIFDTLLIRPYIKPTDLFLHIEKLYKIKGFHKNRIMAEKLARGKYIDYEDITLNQIYEEIDDKYKLFKEIEIELEERILTIHKENKEIYDYALSLGKKIIIVSDMYLPKEVIEKILIKNNYTNYYKLYLSSDLMLTKASANLYKYIINDLRVKPSTIMHLGDNYHSDFENARLYGIDAFFIEKIIDIFLKSNIRAEKLLHKDKNNIGVSIMFGLSALSCFNKNDKNKENNYRRNFGFIYGGPAVFSYMNWLKKQIIKENIKEVLFVARDGYSLKKVFDIIKPEYIKTHYIYAPRIIYYLIALDFKYYNLGDSVKSVLEYYKDKDESKL